MGVIRERRLNRLIADLRYKDQKKFPAKQGARSDEMLKKSRLTLLRFRITMNRAGVRMLLLL